MDPVNERRVFDLIVRTASQPDTAQYFLLSPKVRVHLPCYMQYLPGWDVVSGIHFDGCDEWTALLPDISLLQFLGKYTHVYAVDTGFSSVNP